MSSALNRAIERLHEREAEERERLRDLAGRRTAIMPDGSTKVVDRTASRLMTRRRRAELPIAVDQLTLLGTEE